MLGAQTSKPKEVLVAEQAAGLDHDLVISTPPLSFQITSCIVMCGRQTLTRQFLTEDGSDEFPSGSRAEQLSFIDKTHNRV